MTQEPTTPIAVRPSSAFIPRGLHGHIVEQLGSQIVSGVLKPDALLQPEQIGAAYEASRTVIREALRVLETKGLISARPNVGTRIRPVEQWNLLDADVLRWRASAGRDERLNADIRVFTEMMLALRPALEENLLYRQLLAALGIASEQESTAKEDEDAETDGVPTAASSSVTGWIPSTAGPDTQGAFVATTLGSAPPAAAAGPQLAEAAA